MLNLNGLQRDLNTEKYTLALARLTRNGLPVTLSLRSQFEQQPVAILALALRRIAELPFGQEFVIDDLIRRINSRAAEPDLTPATLACVVAATGRVLRDVHGLMPDQSLDAGVTGDDSISRVRQTYWQALSRLAETQQEDGLFTGPLSKAEQLEVSAFCYYMVADDAVSLNVLQVGRLAWTLEECEGALSQEAWHLWTMARQTRPARLPVSLRASQTEAEVAGSSWRRDLPAPKALMDRAEQSSEQARSRDEAPIDRRWQPKPAKRDRNQRQRQRVMAKPMPGTEK